MTIPQRTLGSRGTTPAAGRRKVILAQFLRYTNESKPPFRLVNRDPCAYLQLMNLKASRKALPLAGE
jgi:hypothetical protein